MSAQVHEASRLEMLRACQILDTPPEKAFDDLVRLATMMCESSIGLVNFVDEERLWVKAAIGTSQRSMPRRGSFCDWAIRALTPSVIEDVARDTRFAADPFFKNGVRFYAGAPVVVAGRYAIGTLCVLDAAPRQLSPRQCDALALLAEQVVAHLELRRQAIRDSLTDLFNRRYLEEALRREVARAARQGLSVGVLMFDMDNFKQLNDTLGHAFGDGVLRRLGAVLRTHLRAEDVACRYGGDEFVLLMPGLTLLEAQARAEELRLTASRALAAMVGASGPPMLVTLSVGVAAYPFNGIDCDQLLKSVDAALYTAKAHGRDCVSVAGPRTAARRPGPLMILLVDDYEDSSELYGHYLRTAGMRVELARDGLSAVETARRHGPDLIVMDLRLPLLNGFEATRRLKADPGTRHIPVIALTGEMPGSEEEARGAGCDGFLLRPCLPERLLAEIRRLT